MTQKGKAVQLANHFIYITSSILSPRDQAIFVHPRWYIVPMTLTYIIDIVP